MRPGIASGSRCPRHLGYLRVPRFLLFQSSSVFKSERRAILFAVNYGKEKKNGPNCSVRFHSADIDVTRGSRRLAQRKTRMRRLTVGQLHITQ